MGSVRARGAISWGAAGGHVWVQGPAGAAVRLTGRGGVVVREAVVDDFGDRLRRMGITAALRGRGGLVLRGLAPGPYELQVGDGAPQPVPLAPDDQFPADYGSRVLGRRLAPGYGYAETRDGTRLSINVALPDPEVWGPGPYATVIQCSAYHDSRPDLLTGDPALDDGMNTEINVVRHLGFAVVGVNARGTGGSGGAFRMFDRLHGLDGYDVVEAVAAQPWCRAVGMIGSSGPGFMALRVAASAPPSLAAVAPSAVLAQGFGSGRRPGGLVNSWVIERLSGWDIDEIEGLPAGAHPSRYRPGGWDEWVTRGIAVGDDPTMTANQLLRGQSIPPMADFVEDHDDAAEERTAPRLWVPTVRCPTLLIGSWQDQESGPGWAEMVDAFPADTEVCLLGTNGTHEETRFPEAIALWAGFLSERLRGEPLVVTSAAEDYLEAVLAPLLGPGPVPVIPRRAGPPAHGAVVRLENGAGPGGPGYPTARRTVAFGAWPPTDAESRTWALTADHGLAEDAPPEDASVTYRYDPSIRPPNSGGGESFDVNHPDVAYDWRILPIGFGLDFLTAPMVEDVVVCGPSSLDLWLRCTAPDVDLEVSLTEIRPDGWETFVQSGWLRAGRRRLDPVRSQPLRPEPTYRREDVAPLPADRYSEARVAIASVAHLLRAGSRLAVRIEPPGGVQPTWTFAPLWPEGRHQGRPVRVEVGVGPSRPSRLRVPLLGAAGRLTPGPLPPPGALRRQPSRRIGPLASAGDGLDRRRDHARAAVDGVVLGDVATEVRPEPSP